MNIQQTKIKILALDLKGCVYLNHFSHQKKVSLFFKWISRLGDGLFWYLMLAIIWYLQGIHYSFQILYIVIACSVGTAIYKVLKHQTTRPRPYQVHQVIQLGERPLDHFSFPSGHTLHAVMATIVLGYIEPILLLVMLPFTVLVALSRMILGLHYPTDVLMGAFIGVLVAISTIQLAPYLHLPL